MNLDDRLRGAYERQLEEVNRTVDVSGREFQPNEIGLSTRLVVAGVAAGLLLIGLVTANRLLSPDPGGLVEAAEGSESELSEATPQDGDDDVSADVGGPTTTSLTVETTTGPDDGGQETEPTTSVPASSMPQAASSSTESSTAQANEDSPESSTQPSPTTEPTPATVPGVANEVCPSGTRAELEWAALQYLGDSRGWGRMDDLVDEQDGPYYFEAWEPQFADPVTVQIILRDPVLATEIRVAQDPFTAVGGVISIGLGERRVDIELSGIGGWRVHEFDEPEVIDRLTITRQEPASNIMEVMICTTEV